MLKMNPLVSDVADKGIESKTNAVKVVRRSNVDGKSGHEPSPPLEKLLQAGSTVIPHQKKLKQMTNEKPISSQSDFMWNKKETDWRPN
uniref:WH2 domain-containing protein n=2 Tax=Loa loa TaxID=7209 RepID=A0A1I7V751_LOALO